MDPSENPYYEDRQSQLEDTQQGQDKNVSEAEKQMSYKEFKSFTLASSAVFKITDMW